MEYIYVIIEKKIYKCQLRRVKEGEWILTGWNHEVSMGHYWVRATKDMPWNCVVRLDDGVLTQGA